MQKGLMILLLGVVIGLAYISYTNHHNEANVYQFCSQMAAGNDETVIDQFLTDSPLINMDSPSLTQRWVTHADSLPLTDRYICQISIEQQKIIELNVVKQGLF